MFPLSVKRFLGFLSKIFFSRARTCLTHSILLYLASEKFRISAPSTCGDHPSPTGIPIMSAHYPTDKGVAARVEELLREQLLELGEDPATLAPHLIMQNMQCEVYPDDSMVYVWKDIPILRVVPPQPSCTKKKWRR